MPNADINGFSMYYEIHGEGEPVVCSTGWGLLTGARFPSLPQALRDRYRLIVYDHRGIGRSSEGPDVPGSARLYAEDVAALMRHLHLDRAHVLGRGGLGACVMQELAINYPEMVHSLALNIAYARPAPYRDALIRLFYTLRKENSFESFQLFGAVTCYSPQYFDEHHSEILGPEGAWTDVRDRWEAHLKLIQACMKHDAYDRLPSITAPTIVIQPGDDPLSGPRLGKELQSRIPDAELVILDGVPHVISSVPAAHAQLGATVAAFFARHPIQ